MVQADEFDEVLQYFEMELKSISYNMYIILYIAYVFIHIYIIVYRYHDISYHDKSHHE
jgi:membrane protein YdbS with pleckstrin-like domain